MTLQDQLRPLLDKFDNATGRGNIIVAHDVMARIIQTIAEAIDHPNGVAVPVVAPVTMTVPDTIAAPVRRPRGRPRKVR